RPLLRVRRPVAPGVPPGGRSLLHRRPSDPRRGPQSRQPAQERRLRAMKIVNPWNGAKIAEVTADDARSVAAKYRQARVAQPRWAAVPVRKRIETIARFRERVVALEETLARTLTQEVGKPIR